ncbi:hypothetical protein FACS189454_00040 [Planctomycetales bacterium]|nr:hypothetical protein FACS189454_00040 [Planctomycetales bacterium]
MNTRKFFTTAALFVIITLASVGFATAHGPNHGGYQGGYHGDRYHDNGRYNPGPRHDNRHWDSGLYRYQDRTPYHRVGGYNSYGHSGYGVWGNPHSGINIRIDGCR